MIKSIKAKIEKDKHISELLRGSTSSLTVRVIGGGFGYLFTLIIGRVYGAEAAGIFALSFTVLQISAVLGRLGMDSAMLRFIAEYSARNGWDSVRASHKKASKAVLAASLFLSVGAFFLSPNIARYIFHKESLDSYFRIISLGIVPYAFVLLNAESLRGLKKIKQYAFLQNTSNFLFASVFLGASVLIYRDIRMPIIAYTVATFISYLTSYVLWSRETKKKPAGVLEKGINLRGMLRVSMPMLLSNSLFFIVGWTSTIMLGAMSSEKDVGIFNVSLKVASLTSITLMAVNSIAAPKFGELWGTGKIRELRGVAQKSAKMMFWASFPVLLVFFFFPSFVLGMFGSEFKVGATALVLLSIGQFVNASSGSVGQILKMTGMQDIQSKIILAASVLNVTMNYFLIPRLGFLGAAISSMCSTIFWNTGFLIAIYKEYKFVNLYLPFAGRVYGFFMGLLKL